MRFITWIAVRIATLDAWSRLLTTNWSFLGDSLWSGDNGYYLMLASDNNMITVVVGFSRTLPNLLLPWVPLTLQPAVTVYRCQTYNLGGVFKE